MIILILLILIAAGLMAVRKQQKARAKVNYWAHINELEAQRKEQILATAIKCSNKKILTLKLIANGSRLVNTT